MVSLCCPPVKLHAVVPKILEAIAKRERSEDRLFAGLTIEILLKRRT